jgi:hypothetical protein
MNLSRISGHNKLGWINEGDWEIHIHSIGSFKAYLYGLVNSIVKGHASVVILTSLHGKHSI